MKEAPQSEQEYLEDEAELDFIEITNVLRRATNTTDHNFKKLVDTSCFYQLEKHIYQTYRKKFVQTQNSSEALGAVRRKVERLIENNGALLDRIIERRFNPEHTPHLQDEPERISPKIVNVCLNISSIGDSTTSEAEWIRVTKRDICFYLSNLLAELEFAGRNHTVCDYRKAVEENLRQAFDDAFVEGD